MIPLFPPIVADELFYGLLGRIGTTLGGDGGMALLRQLFGLERTSITVDLPNRLDDFVARLPPGCGLGVSDLIERWTTLPYLSRFQSESAYSWLMAVMSGAQDRGMGPGRSRTKHAPPGGTLRLCPECILDDRRAVGLSTWHTSHHLPIVCVCPRHLVPLRSTLIRTPFQKFVVACPPNADGTTADPLYVGRGRAGPLAKAATWLLANSAPPDPDLPGKALALLRRDGSKWIGCDGRVRLGVLRERLMKHFGTGTLDALRISTDQQPCEKWLRNMFPGLQAPPPRDPSRWLLLLDLLGASPSDLFKAEPDYDVPVEPRNARGISGVAQAKILAARKNVEKMLENRPDLSRTQLTSLMQTSYVLLARHDREWLRARVPATSRGLASRALQAYDLELADVARKAAEVILSVERPKRITREALRQFLPRGLSVAKISGMPTLDATLNELVEGDWEFDSRRLAWVAKKVSAHPSPPVLSRLNRLLHLRRDPAYLARFKAEMIAPAFASVVDEWNRRRTTAGLPESEVLTAPTPPRGSWASKGRIAAR